jgi:hypothetical protein
MYLLLKLNLNKTIPSPTYSITNSPSFISSSATSPEPHFQSERKISFNKLIT